MFSIIIYCFYSFFKLFSEIGGQINIPIDIPIATPYMRLIENNGKRRGLEPELLKMPSTVIYKKQR